MSSKSIHNNPQASPQSPNPTHIANMPSPSSPSSGTPAWLVLTILITALAALAALAGGIYMSGYSDDVTRFIAEKYFKAEAKAEEKALEKAGATQAEGFLKDRLKKNPVVSNDELNEVSGGLGDEAEREFGKGGLAQGIGRAFD